MIGFFEQILFHPVIILLPSCLVGANRFGGPGFRDGHGQGWGENGRGFEHPDIIPRIALAK